MLSGIGNPKPTDEQQAIIEAAREGGHVAIQAGAGTGKTSTLQMVADALPTDALYVAYNRAIADDAAMRFPRHVTCRTAHSLAMREVGKDYRHRLNGPRRTNREIAQMMGLRWLEVTSDTRLSPTQVARIVMDTVRRFCYSADEHLSDFHVPLQPKITGTAHRAMAKAVAPLATKYWNDVIDYNGTLPYTHDCQPPGTLVRRVVQRGGTHGDTLWEDVPIERIREGDRVVSFTNTRRRGYVRRDGRLVTAVGFRDYSGDLITTTTNHNRSSSYTDTHKCIVRLDCDLTMGNHLVYLARKGHDYRIGRTTWRTRSQGNALGLRRRAESQQVDAIWVLSVHASDAEAALEEALVSHYWRLPTWQFRSVNETMPLRAFWAKVGNNVADARSCLSAHGLSVEYPFWQRGDGWETTRRPVVMRAMNLLSGMLVLEPDEITPCHNGYLHAYNGSGGWSPITVTRSPYDGPVYNLDVEADHSYVADGIVTHNCYLKTWALTKPILPVDVIFLDEGQDANPVIAALVENQSHAQQIVVGDACQQLYSWRGASDVLSTWPGARQLYLSQSWRFGEAIADEANKWLSLLPTSLELTGNPAIASRLAVLDTPTAVLCRTNAGAMDMVMAFLDAGEKVAMVGGGTALCQLAEAAKTLMAGQRTGHPELYTFRSWEDVRDYVGTDGSGDDLRAFVNLIETHGPDAIIRATKALTDEFHATTVVSTVHKSKGRQWPTVCVGDDFFGPDDDGHLPSAEAMVGYVAVTRAQEILDRTGLAWIDDYVDRLTSDTTE